MKATTGSLCQMWRWEHLSLRDRCAAVSIWHRSQTIIHPSSVRTQCHNSVMARPRSIPALHTSDSLPASGERHVWLAEAAPCSRPHCAECYIPRRCPRVSQMASPLLYLLPHAVVQLQVTLQLQSAKCSRPPTNTVEGYTSQVVFLTMAHRYLTPGLQQSVSNYTRGPRWAWNSNFAISEV